MTKETMEERNAFEHVTGMKKECGVCFFWEAFLDEDKFGDCRRYPATVSKVEGKTATIFPTMHRTSWCGGYKPDELRETMMATETLLVAQT